MRAVPHPIQADKGIDGGGAQGDVAEDQLTPSAFQDLVEDFDDPNGWDDTPLRIPQGKQWNRISLTMLAGAALIGS